jgi:hypothetical protein
MIKLNLVGQRFGRLLVLKDSGERKGQGVVWECLCDCGKKTKVQAGNLKNNHTKSCGCLNREVAGNRARIHGMTGTKPYRVWTNMKERCYKLTCKEYKWYGKRGIKICERWRNSFENFWDDMKAGYIENLTLDRTDNNKNYCKDNCRWTTQTEQSNNRRDNRIIEFNGNKKTMAEWAKYLKVNYHSLANRIITHKWSIERAFSIPYRNAIKDNNLQFGAPQMAPPM